LVVREILKEEDVVPGSLTNFTTQFNIRANTEQVIINGQIQPVGATDPGTYTISGAKTVVFNENVENDDFIVITYIKG
jgi:hypothetical protein